MRRDLPPHRFGEARARFFLSPREAEEEARELDAVVERRGREVVAAQLFMERRGDGVHQTDYSGHDRNPRVAESLMAWWRHRASNSCVGATTSRYL